MTHCCWAESSLNISTIRERLSLHNLSQPTNGWSAWNVPANKRAASGCQRAGSTFKLLTTRQSVTGEVLIHMLFQQHLVWGVTDMFGYPMRWRWKVNARWVCSLLRSAEPKIYWSTWNVWSTRPEQTITSYQSKSQKLCLNSVIAPPR